MTQPRRLLPWLAALLAAAIAPGAALAKAGSGNPSQEPQPAPIAPVFVYVFEPGQMNPSGDPLQQLREARITVSGARRGYDVKTLADNKGDGSPETFQEVHAAPGNRLAISYSVQLPLGAVDHDLRVFDLAQHKLLLFFNEHSLASLVHRATCDSKQLDAYIASEAAMGVPQSQLANYDFALSVEGQDEANVPQIQLIEWVNDNTVHLTWPMYILMGPSLANLSVHTMETFDFQVKVTGTGAPKLVACTAPAVLQTPPRPTYVISPSATGPAGEIKIDGAPLNFPPLVFHPGPQRRINPRQADKASGNIPKTGPYAAP